MYKKILVALSGTQFTPVAIRHALDLAHRHQARVTGVAVRDPSLVRDVGALPIGAATAAKTLVDQRTEEIERHIDTEVHQFELLCQRAEIEPTVVRRSDEASGVLSDLWRYHDLIIIGLRGLFEYGVVKTPHDIVARLISQKVRPIVAVGREYRPIRRVLIAYNGSMGSASAFKSFLRSRLWTDVELKVVVFNRTDEADRLLGQAEEYCSAYGYEAETQHVRCTAPREALLEEAYLWKADMIVMGSRSKRHIMDYVLGSMTTQVLGQDSISVYLTQ